LTFTVRVIICYFTAVYLYCLLIRYCFYHSLVNKDFQNGETARGSALRTEHK